MTRVRVLEECFIEGNLRRLGTEFEYTPTSEDGSLPPFLKDLDEGMDTTKTLSEKTDDGSAEYTITKEDLRAKLAQLGVKTAPQTGIPRLLQLLAEVEGKSEPEVVKEVGAPVAAPQAPAVPAAAQDAPLEPAIQPESAAPAEPAGDAAPAAG